MTSLDEHCDPCDLPLATCPHGRPQADRLGPSVYTDLMVDGPTIDATQYGDCAGCTRRIVPGQRITHTEYGWAHEEHVEPREPRSQMTAADFEGL